MPALRSRTARWAGAAADFIEQEAQRALARVQGVDPATPPRRAWLELPAALRDPVLRRWLRALGLDEPAHFHVAELERQLRDAAEDRSPCVSWARSELRRYRDLLYAMPALAPMPADWQGDWRAPSLPLPDGGRLEWQQRDGNARTAQPDAPALTVVSSRRRTPQASRHDAYARTSPAAAGGGHPALAARSHSTDPSGCPDDRGRRSDPVACRSRAVRSPRCAHRLESGIVSRC
jgi:hypothetical protein